MHVCAVTVSRSDFSYLLPILRRLYSDRDFRLSIVVSGTHLAPEYGLTVSAIVASGLPIAERVETFVAGDSPISIAASMGLGVSRLAEAYARIEPDLLLLVGDRVETLCAAAAIVPFVCPIAHVAGGEITEGAIDDAIRHAITKLSHLHFVSTERYRDRVIQMGEEPWRVTVTGAPSLDNAEGMSFATRQELEASLEMPLNPGPLMVTFHPATLEPEQVGVQIDSLMRALATVSRPVVFTYPSADACSSVIIGRIRAYAEEHADSRVVFSLGTELYFSLMRHASAMVGNSSSGIIEAATFALPVVNIGTRQRGRVHGANVLNVDCEAGAIVRAIETATSGPFRRSIARMRNPYGDGHAAERIVDILRRNPPGSSLMKKRFHDIEVARAVEIV